MRKTYDDFTQLKLKDMSKTMSDMTYQYLDKDGVPTVVPASHYEKLLNEISEDYIAAGVELKFLEIMMSQLKALRDENKKLFYQALMCLDLGLKPKDLRINEQIAIGIAYNDLEEMEKVQKKNFHFMSEDILGAYNNAANDPELQGSIIAFSSNSD